MPTPRQNASTLMTHFKKEYWQRFGQSVPNWNSNKLSYGFQNYLLDCNDMDEAKEVIAFYVQNYEDPTGKWFVQHYEKIFSTQDESQEEDEVFNRLLDQTNKRIINNRKGN